MSETRRKLRARAERRQYVYKDLPDEEIDESPAFSLKEKLECPRFSEVNLVKEMKGNDLNFKYFQDNGLNTPILVKEQKGLNMKVPNSKTFYIRDVERFIGPDRLLDVMDVKTQKNLEMTLKEWCDYFLNPVRKELLNVISLEFSHTPLADQVEPPNVIKQLDWVNTVWPQFLKQQQKQSTNAIQEMKYPKVQKYCLMSPKNCYTDFHIDFGGTSVWYHILRGKKVFWLIPPTALNMELYEQWVLSGKQSNLFFGDTVEHCTRVTLYGGETFFIPSGWIHAVYTPEDSLVFGGNFLFSCAMESQIKIYQLENTTKVPVKFRYPFFNELHWYVLSNYIECLTGKCYLSVRNDGTPVKDEDKKPDQHYSESKWNLKEKDIYLEEYESNGLNWVIKYLSKLPKSKQNVPSLITNAVSLINDAKQLVANRKQYEKNEKTNSTSRPVLYWLCKLNYESYLEKLSSSKNESSNSSTSATTTDLTSPLTSWGAGLQNVNTKFIAYKNKLNSEAEHDKKKKAATDLTNKSVTKSTEIPNSFEKLIAATDISNKNDKKQATKSHTTPASLNYPSTSTITTSINSTVNNTVYLTNPSSLSLPPNNPMNAIKPPTVTSMNVYASNHPTAATTNLIMNRPLFNGPPGLQTNFNQPGIIYTNPTSFNPQANPATGFNPQANLYAQIQPTGLQSGLAGPNFNNYNLISNTPMLTTTPAGLSVLPVMNNMNLAANKPSQFVESHLTANKNPQQPQQPAQFTSSWLQPTTIIQSTQQTLPPTTSTNIKTSGSQQTSSNKSSKSNFKQSSNKQQVLQTNPSSIQPSYSTAQPTNISMTNTPAQQHQFLSTTAHKQPVNSMFNLADPTRPNPVINFASSAPNQPTAANAFITPTLNTNLAHQLNPNFIITPVTSNITGNLIAGNNLIPNPIYPNFITSNVIPGNMLVNPGANLQPTGLVQAPNIQPAISQQIVQIGKPTIKLQRINCRKCVPCNRNSCGLCSPCLEYYSKYNQMPPANNMTYSGNQIIMNSPPLGSEICLAKKCLNPLLPYASVCCVCGKNGWHNLLINSSDQQQIMQLDSKNNLLECDTCNQIVHLDCVRSNLPPTQKSLEGRMNSHLANSWTCPVCVPIKDKEASNKLNSSLSKNKQHDLINNQQPSKPVSSNSIRYESTDKSDKLKRQSDLQSSNKNKDQAKFSFASKSASSSNLNSSKANKFYSSASSDQLSKTVSQKNEIYDFDPDEDERKQPTKGTKFNKKQEQKNDNFSTNLTSGQNRNINKKNNSIGKNENQQSTSSIKLPPKKMAKSKLNHQDEPYSSDDKLLLLANTSCLSGQKSSVEKSKLDQNKSKNIASNEKKSLTPSTSSKDQEEGSLGKNKSSTPSTSSISTASAAQQNSSKPRNKPLQSVRGRLEQQLKALKKKTDSKNFNFAYRKLPTTSQPSQVKTNLTGSTKSSVSTANSFTSQSTTLTDTLTTTTSSSNSNKETVVSNCLKNDCILYPNSNKDTKDLSKDALLNKFKNVSSTSLDTSFHKEDSSNDSLGKLEIDTNLESINEKLKDKSTDKSPKTSKHDKSSKKDSDAILNSPNQKLYECESSSAKLLPMSYSIEKLASSTSINQQLEPAPPSTFISSFDSSLNSDLTGSKFGDKLKLQSDLFPNLSRYGTSGLSNWSNAFSKDKQLSSPSFNYSSTTPVFGAFSRTNPTSFGSPTFASLNSGLTASKPTAAIIESDKKKKDLEKDYYTSTEDEADDQAANKKHKNASNDEDTDVQTDIEDQELDESVKRVINEQLMKTDEDDEDEIISDKKSKTTKKKGKAESKKVEKKAVEKKVEKKTTTKASTAKQAKASKNDSTNKEQAQQKGVKRGKNVKQTGKANKKSKKAIEEEEEEEEEQLTEEEEVEIKPIKPIKSTAKTTKATKGKNEKSKQPAKASSTTKNRTSLNTSTSSSATTTPTKKDTKQTKKTTPSAKSKGKATNSKAKNKSSTKTASPNVSIENKRKSEVDKLLDQSSDRSADYMFNESIYETIADKVKVGRKSKLAAASALQLSALPAKQLENLISPKQTPTKKQTNAKASKAAKKTTASKKNVTKDEETDLDSDEETNVDDDSLFEEPASTKKSTSKGNVSKKRKLKADTSAKTTPAKRKSGRGK